MTIISCLLWPLHIQSKSFQIISNHFKSFQIIFFSIRVFAKALIFWKNQRFKKSEKIIIRTLRNLWFFEKPEKKTMIIHKLCRYYDKFLLTGATSEKSEKTVVMSEWLMTVPIGLFSDNFLWLFRERAQEGLKWPFLWFFKIIRENYQRNSLSPV